MIGKEVMFNSTLDDGVALDVDSTGNLSVDDNGSPLDERILFIISDLSVVIIHGLGSLKVTSGLVHLQPDSDAVISLLTLTQV